MKTGLSIKLLGRYGYFREYYLRFKKPKLDGAKIKPRWTGLSDKNLGHAEYTRRRRELIAKRQHKI